MELRTQIAMECHAQLTRFVVQKQMTHEQAADFAVKHTDALIARLNEAVETAWKPGFNESDLKKVTMEDYLAHTEEANARGEQ